MIHTSEHPRGDDFGSVYENIPDPSPVAKQTVINAVQAEIRETFGKNSGALQSRKAESGVSRRVYFGLSVCAVFLVAAVVIYSRSEPQKFSHEYSRRDEQSDSAFNAASTEKRSSVESGEASNVTRVPALTSNPDYAEGRLGEKVGGGTRDTDTDSSIISDPVRPPSVIHGKNTVAISKHTPSLEVLDSDSSAVLYTSLLSGLDSNSISRLTTILEKTRIAGLPVKPLEARIVEGIKRDIPVERIIVVAKNYSDALLSAESAIGPRSSSELQLGAEVILAGVSTDELKSMNKARSNGSLVRPLLALTDLITRGIMPTGASSAIMALLEKNNSDVRIQAFQAEVAGRIQNGTLPDAALTTSLQKYGLRSPDSRQDINRIDSMPRTDKAPRGN